MKIKFLCKCNAIIYKLITTIKINKAYNPKFVSVLLKHASNCSKGEFMTKVVPNMFLINVNNVNTLN